MPRFVSVGECMIEMSGGEDGNYRLGYAGDTLNTAWYARARLGEDWDVDYVTALGDDIYSERMADFFDDNGIGIDHIQMVEGRRPGLYMIHQQDGDRRRNRERDAEDGIPRQAARGVWVREEEDAAERADERERVGASTRQDPERDADRGDLRQGRPDEDDPAQDDVDPQVGADESDRRGASESGPDERVLEHLDHARPPGSTIRFPPTRSTRTGT